MGDVVVLTHRRAEKALVEAFRSLVDHLDKDLLVRPGRGEQDIGLVSLGGVSYRVSVVIELPARK